jgi:protoporphyrinogen oxidase
LAEITFNPHSGKAKLGQADIIERTISDLQRIGVLQSQDVVFTRLVTCKHAYVVYDLDYQKNIKIIEDFAAGRGITLLGRWGEFRYHNSDKCVENALEKARLFI